MGLAHPAAVVTAALFSLILATTGLATGLAAAPSSAEIICDLDRTQFRTVSSRPEATLQLWSAPHGGTLCASYAIAVEQIEAVQTKTATIGSSRSRTFMRLRSVVGDDANPAHLCDGGRTWIDLRVAANTFPCALSGRRRLHAVPYARQTVAGTLPPGVTIPFAGDLPPDGWLRCDGSAVSRTTYAALFEVIGTRYGSGDGSNTFNLPDLRGRAPVGKGIHVDVDSLGDNDGLGIQLRSPRNLLQHTHFVPQHTHNVDIWSGIEAFHSWAPDCSRRYPAGSSANFDCFAHGHGVIGSTLPNGPAQTGGPSPGPDAGGPGFLTMSYIIKQ